MKFNVVCLLAAVGTVSAGLQPRGSNAGQLLELRPQSSKKLSENARVSDKAANHSMAAMTMNEGIGGLNLFARQDGCSSGYCTWHIFCYCLYDC